MRKIARFTPVEAHRYLRHRESLFRSLGIRPHAHRQNPMAPGVVDVVTQSLYDQVTFAQGASFTKTLLFQQPKGQGGKTLANTNMTQPGQLPNPQRFTVMAICVYILNNTIPADFANLLNNVSLEFDVNTKWYVQGPLAMFPAGRGFKLDAAAQVGQAPSSGGAVDLYSAGNGVPDYRSVYVLDAPVTIEQGEQFQVILNPETAFSLTANTTNPPGVGTVITVYLDGNLERGVS